MVSGTGGNQVNPEETEATLRVLGLVAPTLLSESAGYPLLVLLGS